MLGNSRSPLSRKILPSTNNSVIKVNGLEKSASRYIRQKRPIPAISTLQHNFNSLTHSPLRVPNYELQNRLLRRDYSQEEFMEDLP